MNFIEACRKLVAIDTSPNAGSLEAAKFVSNLAKDLGLYAELQETVVQGLAQANVIIRPNRERAPQEILFQSHIDTVEPATYSLWTETDSNPYNCVIHGDKIFGLGTNGGKLDILCKLQAASSFKSKKLKTPFVVAATYGEQLGMHGAKKLFQEEKLTCDMALVGEPSGLNLIYATQGIAVIEIFIPFTQEEVAYRQRHYESESTSTHNRIFRGKSANSSTPEKGESAISKMITYLEELPQGLAVLTLDGGIAHNIIAEQAFLEVDVGHVLKNNVGQKVLKLWREFENLSTDFLNYSVSDFSPPCPTYNVGLIRTHEDGVQVLLSLRLNPAVSYATLQQWWARLKNFCLSMDCRMKIKDYQPPCNLPKDSHLAKACSQVLKQLSSEFSFKTKASCLESSIFSQRRIDCIAFAAGDIDLDCGSPNEHNSLQQLEKSIEFYRLMTERLCL